MDVLQDAVRYCVDRNGPPTRDPRYLGVLPTDTIGLGCENGGTVIVDPHLLHRRWRRAFELLLHRDEPCLDLVCLFAGQLAPSCRRDALTGELITTPPQTSPSNELL